MITRSKLAASTTLGLILGIVVITAGFGRDSATSASPADPIMVADTISDPQTGQQRIAGLGVVEPRSGEVDLAGLMPGVISVIHVQEGDSVKKDQILAELVNDDLKAKVAQAKAQLTIRRAEFDRVRNGAREQEISQAQAQLKQEEGTLSLLKLQYDRRKKLAKAGAVSQETFNAAESALIAGQQRRDAAEQALSLLAEGSRPEDLMAFGAQVELAQHQLEEAEAALGKSYIKASTDGIVLRLYREAGEALSTQPASPIIQIGDTSRLVVRAQIDEADIGKLKLGQKATVTAQALGGTSLEGVVQRISPRVGAKTIVAGSPTEKRDARVLDVMIGLDPQAKLPISLRVDVFIEVGEGAGEPTAPAADAEGAPAAGLEDGGTSQPDVTDLAASGMAQSGEVGLSPSVATMQFGDKVSSIGPAPSARDALGGIHPELDPGVFPGTKAPAAHAAADHSNGWTLAGIMKQFGDKVRSIGPAPSARDALGRIHPELDPGVFPGTSAPASTSSASRNGVAAVPVDGAANATLAAVDEPVAPDLSTWSLRTAP